MINHSYSILYCLLSLLFVGCASHYNSTSTDTDSSFAEGPFDQLSDEYTDNVAKDSSMIGDIFLGMNEKDFNEAKAKFLKENPSLSDIKIAKMRGYFYKDKLVRIIIISNPHLNSHGGVEKNNKCFQWTDLYKRKYNTYNEREIFPTSSRSTVFSKNQCLIIVTDDDPIDDVPIAWDNDVMLGLEDLDSNPLFLKRLNVLNEESKAASNRTPGTRFSEKRFSRIDIIDRDLYISTENERSNARKKSKEDKFKNDLDLI